MGGGGFERKATLRQGWDRSERRCLRETANKAEKRGEPGRGMGASLSQKADGAREIGSVRHNLAERASIF